ncbi:hypothetical protein ACH5RR_032270 [Cinchona calisaya]|uniref:Uncharacterized protein n=1 Tax=Cinchona calisaya TaxID=153742 RepID=A0ABD2YIQ2_9GENT
MHDEKLAGISKPYQVVGFEFNIPPDDIPNDHEAQVVRNDFNDVLASRGWDDDDDIDDDLEDDLAVNDIGEVKNDNIHQMLDDINGVHLLKLGIEW